MDDGNIKRKETMLFENVKYISDDDGNDCIVRHHRRQDILEYNKQVFKVMTMMIMIWFTYCAASLALLCSNYNDSSPTH